MKFKRQLFIFLVVYPFLLWPQNLLLSQSNYEIIYQYLLEMNAEISRPVIISGTNFDEFTQKLVVDVLWDMSEKTMTPFKYKSIFKFATSQFNFIQFNTSDQIRLEILSKKIGRDLFVRNFLSEKIINEVERNIFSKRSIFILLLHLDKLSTDYDNILDLIKRNYPMEVELMNRLKEGSEKISRESLFEIFHFAPRLDLFSQGTYEGGVRLFLFCRSDRRFPCLFLMKNADNSIRYLDDKKTPWSLKGLALSHNNLPFFKKNGNTPQGVYTMDGVMPEADQFYKFGEYRRIKLNFIDEVSNADNYRFLLPNITYEEKWWYETLLAKDAGREHLRIHGTGLRNFNPFSKHRAFVATRGCITTREGYYFSKGFIRKFKDQRLLLDEILSSMNLERNDLGERLIKGLLYVIDIDDQKTSVNLQEIRKYLEI